MLRSLPVLLGLLLPGSSPRELDPALCATRFDLQHNKIIRTEESRAMGARYLSELDVGSRAECRRLCCETEACDVFVLEEQIPGSCYLFACGPPEDFRCKFTTHVNFSSGVLALSRRLAELQDQERHIPATPTLPTTHTTPTTTTTRPTTSQAVPRCSRYQFECHSGGECIAVYNACDGIPQCADGSDEAPELGCPPPPDTQSRVKPVQLWPHRLTQAQPPATPHPMPPPNEGEPRIFSHTGGLVQAPNQPPHIHRPPYGEMSEGMGGAWQWNGGWGPAPAAESPVGYHAAESPLGYQETVPMPELPPQMHDAPKKGPPPVPPTVPPTPPPTTTTTLPTPQPTVTHQHHIERTSIRTIHEKLRQESHESEDGPAERPRAAILLLVLGMLMAVAAGGVATGCGRRRGARRGRGARAAHRADYLVNGMYL